MTPTLIGIIPYAGTSFLIWGFLKHDLLPSYLSPAFRDHHRTLLDLGAGGLAGAIGQTSAYPLDIVRRRMQVGPAMDPGRRMGFWETARGVYRVGGVERVLCGVEHWVLEGGADECGQLCELGRVEEGVWVDGGVAVGAKR